NNHVEGNILAGGNVETGNNSNVDGNIGANGDVDLGNNNTVGGDIRYGDTGSFSNGSNFNHLGTLSQGPDTAVTPATFTPLSLPTPQTITPGVTNVNAGTTDATPLAPGAYDALSLANNVDLHLT